MGFLRGVFVSNFEKVKGAYEMADSPNVSLRFSDEEKAALLELAARFHRSQTSILKVLVSEAVAVLHEQDARINQPINNPARVSTRRIKLNS